MEVRVKNVRKEFEHFAALNDVSLDIQSGELIALLGPSGSGKTTLLRLIAGLEFPTEGAIFFGEEDASRKTVQERNIGFVFQHYALFRHMTVAENVGFGLKVRSRAARLPKKEVRARALELLSLVQLPGLENRYPNQLSGGQRQRVALARAMAIKPKVLLLDEPFGALDAQVRRELRSWLREIHTKTGHTTVFVTHDQEEALELADRVVVMNKGSIEQVGTPDEIYDHPGSPFVFGFIGESSKLPVTVGGGQVRYRGAQIDTATEDMPAGEGTMYFRPYDIELVEGSSAAIEGKIVGRRRTAGTRHIELELTGGDRMEIELPPDISAPKGGTLLFRPKKWIVFPNPPAET